MPVVPTVSLTTPTVPLEMPQLGFGVWQVPDDEVDRVLDVALHTGYRSIDTATVYGNEAGVGRALRATDVPRDQIVVTTKVWNDDQGTAKTRAAFEASMDRLGLDVIDLYLIHWPVPRQDRFADTWRAMRRLRDDGLVRAIGVCNFGVSQLQRLYDETGEWPAINQVELHPYLTQAQLRAFHEERGIVTEAWSPLASGGSVLGDPVVTGIAAAHGVTPAQAIIRWHLQLGTVVIPKSVTPSRIAENFDVFGFELTGAELAAISALDRSERTGPNPEDV